MHQTVPRRGLDERCCLFLETFRVDWTPNSDQVFHLNRRERDPQILTLILTMRTGVLWILHTCAVLCRMLVSYYLGSHLRFYTLTPEEILSHEQSLPLPHLLLYKIFYPGNRSQLGEGPNGATWF